MTSQSAQFNSIGNDVDAAERLLIQQWSPCSNMSHNPQPAPIPPTYLPPNASLRRRSSLNQLIREAARAVQAEDNHLW